MYHNVVIGKPLVDPAILLSYDQNDWETNEKHQTLFTDVRNLATVMKEAGVVQSVSEVRRNKPELNITLNKLDCFWVKWGKKRLYVIVGE